MLNRPIARGSAPARLKILYVQPGTDSFAGIERVVHTVCSQLAEKYSGDLDIDVLYTSIQHNRPSGRSKYTSIDSVTTGKISLMRTLRRVVGRKRYDLVVLPQIEPTVICMVSCLGIPRRFVVHLHGNPRLENSHVKAKILFFLMKAFFVRRVTSVFGTSPRQLESFKAMFNSKRPHYWVPNPVRRFDLAVAEEASKDGIITFVNVGRFSFQKGQDTLLEAFWRLYRTRQDIRLRIVGYGEDEEKLRSEIQRLGLQDVATLEHHPNSPQPVLIRGDIYISTSRWEGWSLAICEALRFGLPVISTDCEFGPSDILVDERLGRLVPTDDIDQLVDLMRYYCINLQSEKAHADFRREFVEVYSAENVIHAHAQALLESVHLN
jgi:glycosyltransferase involved in cell wall biosynthesis